MKKCNLTWLLAAGICVTIVGTPAQIKAAESVWTEKTIEAETESMEASDGNFDMISAQMTETELPTGGLLPMEVYELDESELEAEEEAYFELLDKEYSEETSLYRAAYVTSEWDKYKNYYFYNKMSEAQQDFWDDLEVLCDDYLLNNTAGVVTKDGKCRTPLLESDMGLTIEEMKSVARAFRYNNPQYYFINNSLWATSKAVGFGIYTAFATPEDRAAETAKVKAQADTWQLEIDALSTAEEKERLIHDLIIKKVDYNHGIEQSGFDENTQYTQSAYSVFCTDLTVCAGYSQAFAMMCNASGIDTVCVTSSSHEWNKVRLNDSWYNVDCTWDDQGGNKVGYYYFNRNDSVFDTSSSHAESAGWLPYLPVCTLDSASTYSAPGTLPTITEQAETPVISAETVDGTYMVTITSSDPDAEIYYTTDGKTPQVSAIKCKRYSDSFAVTEEDVVQAIAVKNAYWNSDAADEAYDICYDGNTATAGTMERQQASLRDRVTLSGNQYVKTGYQFAGWNSSQDGSGASYPDGAQVTGLTDTAGTQVTLYAKWTPNKYRICFNGNGNDSGQMETMTGLSYDTEYQLTGNLFQKKYHTFISWNTKADGSGETYADGAAIISLTDAADGEVTLYAQWEPQKYKIVYKLNGGKNNKKNPATYTKYTGAVTLKKPTRTGYTFKGWYSNKKCTKKVTGIKKGATGTKTFYAKWQKKKYKINYQLKGGINSAKNPTSYTVTSKTVKLKAPKKNGYVFKGWYTDKKCKKKITKIKKGSVGNLTLYAKWEKIK